MRLLLIGAFRAALYDIHTSYQLMTQREYTRLYQRWSRSPEANRTRAYLCKCGADKETAEECYHLALTDYLAYVSRECVIDNPGGWLHTNAWRKYLRMKKSGGGYDSLDVNDPDNPFVPDKPGGGSSDEEVSSAPNEAIFVSHDAPIEEQIDQPYAWALNQLTERQLEVMRLTYEGYPPLSEEEIAMRMNTTEGTIQQYRFAAKQKIREVLEAIGYAYLLPKRRTRSPKQ